jgi:hypothetical protein
MPWSPVLTHTAEKTAYWAAESKEAGTNEVIQPSTTLGCWDVTLRYARTTPVGTREDDATIGLRIAKVIGGGLYGLGLNSELSTIEARLNTLQAMLATFMSSSFTLAEYIWHVRRASNPAAKGGGEKPGPAVRRTAKNVVGVNASDRQPDQVAATVTFKTCSRRHWGRVYIPGIAGSQVDKTYARFGSGLCDGFATAFQVLINGLSTDGYELGVWSYPKQAFMPVWQVQVDNIVDIQRRRRAKQRSYAKLITS